ncbi:DUF883 family protein [Noviherbaspirillum galbum]|uniref:DUF883 family protein n=1 Tax=Noviherbaspirillum galbum TaxID=2709383 RepID=A0A6B3SL07_9BURK|nr:DUF883 family protein [Noviherbaspirillum galbum]NEX61437.1 DUF883 family protein [Noviherbaspirillum galbum]
MASMDQEAGSVRDRLMSDLKLIIKDAEDLLRSSGSQAGDTYQNARARFESTISTARDGLSDLEQQVMDSGREAISQADEYVQQNPWQAVGIGAAAGLLIGLMLGRR